MQKKSVQLFLIIFLASSVSALSATNTAYNSTYSLINYEANNLYAYEVNLDYSGTVSVSTPPNIFTGCGSSYTSGSNTKNNILSVYASCLNATYSGINVSNNIFNVTHDSSLSLRYILAVYADGTEEYVYYNQSATPSNVPSGGGSSSGGGGGADEFELLPTLIKATINQGETKRESFTITNTLSTSLNITSIDIDSLENFVILRQDSIFLLPGESKQISFDIFAPSEAIPDVHTGQITVKSAGTTKSINIVVEIKEDQPLFDVTVDLEKTKYAPNDNIIGVIEIENFGDLRDIDILLYYAIKDFEGNVISFKEESYAIENYKLQLIGKLKLPKDIENGDYIFYARASYDDVVATGSQVFSVEQPTLSPLLGSYFLSIIALVIVAGVVIVTIIIYFGMRKKSNQLLEQQPMNKV